MTKAYNFIGEKRGQLKVLEVAKRTFKNEAIKIICACDCGNVCSVDFGMWKAGRSVSCGCHKIKSIIARSTTHGMSRHPLSPIYNAMVQRCTNKNNSRYNQYGGRGITICEEWINDKMAFINWALSNGWQQGLQIDRRDNNKGYNPENCRIVTKSINQRNKRTNIILEYNGEIKTLAEWCNDLRLPYQRILTRIKREKLSTKEAFERPNRYKEKIG